ncbi:MAG: hypothetical protein Kow0037_12360 [Calditrichia bacterium]
MKSNIWTFLLLLAGTLLAQGDVVKIKDVPLGNIEYAGFTLRSEKSVFIRAEGAGVEMRGSRYKKSMMHDPGGMFAYAWILDAQTREVVWKMEVDNTEKNRRTRYNRTFEGEVKLPQGEYELYFAATEPRFNILDNGFFSLGRLLNRLLRDEDYYDEDESRWYVQVENVDEAVTPVSVKKFHNALRNNAVVAIHNLRDSDYRQVGFKLSREGEFEIYAIGEAFAGEVFDYAWIVNAQNSQKIWESLPEEAEYAGGAIKNVKWKTRIKLQPGNYWVFFAMDDSHSPEEWNANPPYDPDFYGIMLTGVKGKYDPKSIGEMPRIEPKPIIALNRLGDNKLVFKGFQIEEPMQVRIYAIGEGRRGEMYDYGWIENTNTGEVVWEMDFNRTRHAGGAQKNRLVDEIVTLPAGSYMVYFKTDDSHSYPDWNSSPPYQPTSWGITIYPADPKFNSEMVKQFDQLDYGRDVLAQIVRVGDSRHIQERFVLEQPTQVRVLAIGEGDWDEMYDYGWIENSQTGEIVWEMTYKKSRWAGGARKNRRVESTILLDTGSYVLHFRTDDSHSFEDWNDDPPEDPLHYGITVYKVGKVNNK